MLEGLERALQRGILRGNLRVHFASGKVGAYGDREGPEVAIRFTSQRSELALMLDPAMKLGELYADGTLLIERGTPYALIALLKRNARQFATGSALVMQAWRRLTALTTGRQSVAEAKRNIAHHYNLDEAFYRLFLDDDLQYTCAYFEHRGQSLEDAQLAKKRHLAAKLLLKPGQRVLDIGSGWGGLALYLAQVGDVEVTGVTLSQPQYATSRRRAEERGLTDRVRFELCDYRQLGGSFDRIVSVGMFEAIGKQGFDEFFQKVARLLNHKGAVLLHSIGRTKPHSVPSPWMEKYIFPGSYIPALSEVVPSAERAGFVITDMEILRLHYADTLREWRKRFVAQREQVVKLYDSRFFRMWEFYLAASEAAFRIDRMFIFQMQLTLHQQVVPTSRDYVAQREQELRQIEANKRLTSPVRPDALPPQADNNAAPYYRSR